MKTTQLSAAVVCVLMLYGCGASKKSAYAGYQTKPGNEVQASAANRGVKLETEECEELAFDITAENPREFGNGLSAKESFATNIALLDARSKMAQRIQTYVSGLIVSGESQTGESGSYTNIVGQTQRADWQEYVNNTRVIKKNTYVKEDGQYNVYVCIEMPKEQILTMYNKISEDKIISSEISAQMFLEGLKMSRPEK